MASIRSQDGRPSWTDRRADGHRDHRKQGPTIESGDAGIWATCEMGKEGKCVGELRDLLEEVGDPTSPPTRDS